MADIEKLYQNFSKNCVRHIIDEKYAFLQSLEITIMLVTCTVLMAKLCTVNYDPSTVNKMIYWMYLSLLAWAVFTLVQVCAIYFVDP